MGKISKINQIDWEYFGRHGGSEDIFEIFRAPAGIADPVSRFKSMQRLHQDLVWRDASSDPALGNEWASGWFDFEDEKITEDDVARLTKAWSGPNKWPGRS
ncbi:MAG: hypothetical protein WCK43_08095 [bacterium]